MTWNAFHHRGEILQTVIATAKARRDGVLPFDLPGVADVFHDELDLIAAMHLKWHARLSGNIERELMAQPLDIEAAVATAWARSNDEMPGVRMIIDRYTAEPTDDRMSAALAKAQQKEWLKLAAAAGLSNDESAPAARAGERVEQRARTTTVVAPAAATPHVGEVSSPSLVARIKAVLAA